MTDDRDFASYVSARWTQLVRCLIAVGAPLQSAHGGAAETLSHCHDGWAARDEWVDLDVHVFRDLLDRWDGRRDAWWERPVPDSDTEALTEAEWPEVEAQLDRMGVADRRALVLGPVAGLGPEQVREVLGENATTDAALAEEVIRVIELVPVDPPPLEAMIAASERRRRRRRGVSVASGVALVVVAGVVTALVLGRPDPPGAEREEALPPVRSLPYYNPSPIAWYAAGTLYLPDSRVSLRDVRAFSEWDEGAVYLDVSGNLVSVTGDGKRAHIATLGASSTFGVHPIVDQVVWVDPDAAELVVYDLDARARHLESPLEDDRSRILSVGGRGALLASDDELFEVDLEDGSFQPIADLRLPGELDRHGQFVLTREGGGAATARVRLYDTGTGRPIPLDVGQPRSVTAARFGPDGSVILLVEPPSARVSEVRRCVPPYDVCQLDAFFPAGGARALLPQ